MDSSRILLREGRTDHMSYHDPSTYDLSRFVRWWVRTHPPEDPTLPFDEDEIRPAPGYDMDLRPTDSLYEDTIHTVK